MNFSLVSPGRAVSARIVTALVAVAAVLLLGTSCTQRTVTTRKSSWSISGQGQAGGQPGIKKEESINSRLDNQFDMFRTRNQEGKGDRSSVYENRIFDGEGREARTKAFRGVRDIETPEARTPEYLERQSFNSGDSYSRATADEADFDANRSGFAQEREIERKETGYLEKLLPTNWFRGSDKEFRTTQNREGTRAIENDVTPEPMGNMGAGTYQDGSLSKDQVKRLVSPWAY